MEEGREKKLRLMRDENASEVVRAPSAWGQD